MPNSAEQKNYLKGMKALVELYHLLMAQQDETWFSEIVIQDFPKDIVDKIEELFYYTLPRFENVQYYSDLGVFRYGTGTEITISKKRHLVSFLAIISALHEDTTRNNHVNVIAVPHVEYGIREHIDPPKDQTGRANKLTGTFSWKKPKPKEMSPSGPKIEIIHTPPANPSDAQLQAYARSRTKQLGPAPRYGETFEVVYNFNKDREDTFVDALHDAVLDDSPIMAPIANTRVSFIKAIRYTLVKCMALLGSLDRFKSCPVCGKFFFQDGRIDRATCSDKCRTKASRDAQAPAEKFMFKCLRRQNGWIRSTLLNHDAFIVSSFEPQYLKPADCRRSCRVSDDHYPVRGECPLLRRKNAAAIKFLEDYVKRTGRKKSQRKPTT